MFGKGRIDITVPRTSYAPGDTISGNVTLTLKKPVKAREASISLIGERIIPRSGREKSTTTERIYDFKQQLDSEREYSQKEEYRFEIKIPGDVLSMKPQMPELEGTAGQVLKVAQAAAAMSGVIPLQRTKWYLLAKLDVPGGLDVNKNVDLTIG